LAAPSSAAFTKRSISSRQALRATVSSASFACSIFFWSVA
jgi:hypothetical protein